MATHSSVLAWRIPGTGEPGGLLSLGLHRVRHNWSDLAAAAAAGELRSHMPYGAAKKKKKEDVWEHGSLISSLWFLVPGCADLHGVLLVLSCSVVSTLCNILDCHPPGSSVPGIFQASLLEWVAIFLLQGGLPDPGIESAPPTVSYIGRWILYLLSHQGRDLKTGWHHLKILRESVESFEGDDSNGHSQLLLIFMI